MDSNKSTMESESSADAAAKLPKLCYIVKRAGFDGYGFNLHSEKNKPGQFIGKVDANSPAEEAGLKEGDRIIEVNGNVIEEDSHKQVVQRIKALEYEVRLLLIDAKCSKKSHSPSPLANGDRLSNICKNALQPNLCDEQKSSNSNVTNTSNYPSRTNYLVRKNDDQSEISSRQNGSNFEANEEIKFKINNLLLPESAEKLNNFAIDPLLPPTVSKENHSNEFGEISNNENTCKAFFTGEQLRDNMSEKKNTNAQKSSTNFGTENSDGLQLPITAAEMRAKLMMKKKYDPKNESVDLKKKFDIIQKL